MHQVRSARHAHKSCSCPSQIGFQDLLCFATASHTKNLQMLLKLGNIDSVLVASKTSRLAIIMQSSNENARPDQVAKDDTVPTTSGLLCSTGASNVRYQQCSGWICFSHLEQEIQALIRLYLREHQQPATSVTPHHCIQKGPSNSTFSRDTCMVLSMSVCGCLQPLCRGSHVCIALGHPACTSPCNCCPSCCPFWLLLLQSVAYLHHVLLQLLQGVFCWLHACR